jgi:hypothetical protein
MDKFSAGNPEEYTLLRRLGNEYNILKRIPRK